MNHEATSSTTTPGSSTGNVDRFFEQLDEKVRKSPREAVLVAFLAGALLQVFAVRHLLLTIARLTLWLATPVLFFLTAWRLFQAGDADGSLSRMFKLKKQ
jgi:hypothetical protein